MGETRTEGRTKVAYREHLSALSQKSRKTNSASGRSVFSFHPILFKPGMEYRIPSKPCLNSRSPSFLASTTLSLALPSLDSQPHARVLPDPSLFPSLDPCRVLDLAPGTTLSRGRGDSMHRCYLRPPPQLPGRFWK